VFAEQGLAAEIKDIADRACVGVATIYRGFGSKDELLQATIEQAGALISELLAVAESADDPVEGLRILITGMLDFAESYGWLIQESLAGDEIERLKSSLKERDDHRQRAVCLIERGIESGGVLKGLPVDVVMLLVEGAIVALTLRTRGHKARPSAPAIANGIVGMLTGSLASQNTS
jgi:AcrR family transcriptional regulator